MTGKYAFNTYCTVWYRDMHYCTVTVCNSTYTLSPRVFGA